MNTTSQQYHYTQTSKKTGFSVGKLSFAVFVTMLSLSATQVSANTNKDDKANKPTPAKTDKATDKADKKVPTTAEIPQVSNRQDASGNNVDMSALNAKFREAYIKTGRPPTLNRLPFAVPTISVSENQYGMWRAISGVYHHHTGNDLSDYGRLNGHKKLLVVNGKIISRNSGGSESQVLVQRLDNPAFPDRIAHAHGVTGSANNLKVGQIYPAGTPFGVVKLGHDHLEYAVPNIQKFRTKRIVYDNNRLKQGDKRSATQYMYAEKSRMTNIRGFMGVGTTYKLIDPTPYFPDLTARGQNTYYLGTTLYTRYNALYGTRLEGTKGKEPAGKIPETALNQLSVGGGKSIFETPVTPEMLSQANLASMSSAVIAQDGGFDFSGGGDMGVMMTQQMLASSFADNDGESWQSVMGNAQPANLNEMSQNEIIKYMANRSYMNSEYLANLTKLSTKGLLMENLQQQAEINYMFGVLRDLQLQSLQQKATLARMTMHHADKVIEGLANDPTLKTTNPDFYDSQLEASGDEWIGVQMSGGGTCNLSSFNSADYRDNTPTLDKPMFLGDSIALGYMATFGQGTLGTEDGKGSGAQASKDLAIAGRNPKQILDTLRSQLRDNPHSYRGKTVVLSSGISNNPADFKSVKEQIELLRANQANVILLGVSTTFEKRPKGAKNPTGAELNAELQKIAQASGVHFNGGIETADNDHVHPKQYKKDHIQAVSTPAQAEASSAVESGCGSYVGGNGFSSGMGADLTNIKPKPFRGFDKELDVWIAEASKMFSIDEAFLRGLVKHEDGWTGKISPTGAVGVGQFVTDTWLGLARTAEGRSIGMTTAGVVAGGGNPNDPRRNRKVNTYATALLARNNAKVLQKYGVPTTPENLYMCHNMGCGYVLYVFGKQRFGADTIAKFHRNSGYNGSKRGMSLQEFYKHQTQKYRQNYADANQAGVKH